jgi:hypothetical protein
VARKVNAIDPEEAMKSVGSTGKFLKIDDDVEYDIRPLPPIGVGCNGRPLKTPWMAHTMHSKSVGKKFGGFEVEGGQKVKLHCLDAVDKQGDHLHGTGEECPACRVERYCAEEGEDRTGMQTDTKYMMNVAVDGQIRIFDAPPSVITELQKYIGNKKYGTGIFDPRRGRNFTMKRIMQANGFRKYELTPAPDASPIDPPDWEQKAFNLAKEVHVYKAEEMTEILVRNLRGIVPVEAALDADFEDTDDDDDNPADEPAGEEGGEEEEAAPRHRRPAQRPPKRVGKKTSKAKGKKAGRKR